MLYPGHWSEQTGVQAAGTNDMTTFFSSLNWLREILFLWSGYEEILQSVQINQMSERELTAVVHCDPYDSDRHDIRNEIKAVTYHNLKIIQTDEGLTATIVFDV